MGTRSAIVQKYSDGTNGWVHSWGGTKNQNVYDPATQAIVLLQQGASPDASKPLWKQRVDDANDPNDPGAAFYTYTSEDKDAARIWLASKFMSKNTVLFQAPGPMVFDVVTSLIVVGCWVQDARAGVVSEGSDGRVVGVIFQWAEPVEIHPPVITMRGYNTAGDEKSTLPLEGDIDKKSNDSTTRTSFRKYVTYKNVPTTFRRWELEVSVPTLTGGEQCTLSCLRVSTGRRGAD